MSWISRYWPVRLIVCAPAFWVVSLIDYRVLTLGTSILAVLFIVFGGVLIRRAGWVRTHANWSSGAPITHVEKLVWSVLGVSFIASVLMMNVPEGARLKAVAPYADGAVILLIVAAIILRWRNNERKKPGSPLSRG